MTAAAVLEVPTEPKTGDAREVFILDADGVLTVTAKKHLGQNWWVGLCIYEEGVDLWRTREAALRAYFRFLLEKDTVIRKKIGDIRAELTDLQPRAGCPLCLQPLDGDHDTLNCAISQRSRAAHLREALEKVTRTVADLTDLDTKMGDIGRIATEALALDDTGWQN